MMKKKVELFLAQAWQKQSPWLNYLAPLSKLYGVISQHHKKSYQSGKRAIYKAPVPVLVIGNITVGGSGKTPMIIALVNYLTARGVKVGVISRGYGCRRQKLPMIVTSVSTPDEVGDEPCLIAQNTVIPERDGDWGSIVMAVCPNRRQAIELLLDNYPDIELIISDDGLQHYALYHDEAWIMVDAERGFGNEKLLPQGFLREPVSRLVGEKVVYHYANAVNAKNSPHKHTMYLKPNALMPLSAKTTLSPPSQGMTVYALSGIGYPVRFFNTLQSLGFLVKERIKPDHHEFLVSDVVPLQDLPIVVTAKDATKLHRLITPDNLHLFDNIWVLPVTAVLSDDVLQMLDDFCHRFDLLRDK